MTVEPLDNRPRPLLSVQALRAVAALMVLAYHLVTTSAYGWLRSESAGYEIARWIEAVGFAGVDLFFVISGVVMVYSSYDQLGERREVVPFIKRRVARIYPLYWVCTAAVLAIAWFAPSLATREKFDSPVIAKSFTLWPQSTYPIVAVGWTLTYEMFFYLVFAALIALPRRVLPLALCLWAIGTLVAFSICDQPEFRESGDGHLRLPLYASPLTLEFIAGCLIGWHARSGLLRGGSAALAVALSMLLLAGYLNIIEPQKFGYGFWRVATFGTAAALAAYGGIALEHSRKLSIPSALRRCGDASYSLYLTHMYVLWAVAALWPRAGSATVVDSRITLTLLALAVCGATAAVNYRAVERPLHRQFLQLLRVRRHEGPGRTVVS